MKDRITEFLLKENISPAEFADKIGVQRSSVSHVLNGRNYPGALFLQKMLANYKSLNPRWLLLGEGMMIDAKNPGKEASLFSFPSSEEASVIKDSSFKESISTKDDSLSEVQEKKIEQKSSKTPALEINPALNQIIDDLPIVDKGIERIVLFYKDKTFSVYTPSK